MTKDEIIEFQREQIQWLRKMLDLAWARERVGPEAPWRREYNRQARRLRPLVLERDGGICTQCGSDAFPEVDHIVPLVHGGSNDLANLRVLCRSCNRAKKDRTA